jgi:PhoPQ-activated pathogenicity-related protein
VQCDQVPNEAITFPADPLHKGGRSEDAAIAMTWWHFLQYPDQPEWILELPMTKSAVQALTVVCFLILNANACES